VRTLLDQDHGNGLYVIYWDGRDDSGSLVASGVYFMTLETPDNNTVERIGVVK
jgi:hypothetical protein